jgi:type 1 fimbria pilin
MIFFKSLLPILFTTLLLSFSTSNSFTDFSGKWHAEIVTASFDLKLIQVKGRVSGSHCAIQLGGSKVDCVLKDNDVTIIGNANNSTSVKVTFISQFSQKKGTATITKMNDSTLQWRIITKPKGEYYLPNQMVLKKR